MDSQYNCRFLLKFGRFEHIEALQKKGQIYMSTLAYFRSLPQENLIGDKYEGITYLKHLENLTFWGEHNGKKFAFKSTDIAYAHPTDKIEGNIYCLYGGFEGLLKSRLDGDEGFLPVGDSFGSTDYMAIINNPREFMRRLCLYMDQAGMKYMYSPVNYVNFKNYQGKLNQFHKRQEYEGQNEFRIYVESDGNRPLVFELGDLSDICHIGRTDRHLSLRYKVFDSEAEFKEENQRLINGEKQIRPAFRLS